jgi:tetratricopeptide (TPR) repeat protein
MMGSFDAGEEKMFSSVAAQLAMMDYRIGAKVAGHLAHCYLDQGRLSEAQVLLNQHRELTEKFGIRGGTSHYLNTGLAAATLLAVEAAEGQNRDVALKEAKAACRDLLKSCRTDATSLVPANRMQGTYHWLCGRSDKADEWWRKSLALADKLGARWEGALTHLEIGRRQDDRGALETAEAEFEAMGAAYYLGEARRLLADGRVPDAVTTAADLAPAEEAAP